MSMLSRNLGALPEHLSQQLEQLAQDHYDGALTIESARSGEPTARCGGAYVHSKHDPRREAQRLFERMDPPTGQTLLFYGFGLGYMVEEFLYRVEGGTAVVVEPDAGSMLRALDSRDMTTFLSSQRLYLFVETDVHAVVPLLRSLEDSPSDRLRPPALYNAHRGYFEQLDAAYESLQARSQINANTLQRFGHLWVRNLVRNLPLLERAPGVGEIAGAFTQLPALLLAAGPSLDEVMPHIEQIRRRALLISVDTALPTLQRRGVEPDFVVAVDPQYWNTRHLDWARPRSSVLIAESSTHPRVFRMLETPVRFCSSLFPLGSYFEEWTGERGKLGAGGSVSTTAWDFARTLGCNPIYVAGLDLGFPGMTTHAAGSFFEELAHLQAHRLAPAEGSFYHYLHGANAKWAPSNDGSRVLSDDRMLLYRWWFENQMKMHPETETLNLSRRGLAIEGMPPVPLEHLTERPALPADTREQEALRAPRIHDIPSGVNALAGAVNSLVGELSQLEAIAEEGLRLTNALRQDLDAGRYVALHRLDAVDTRIRSVPHRDIAGFLIQNTLSDVARDATESWTTERLLTRSQEIYRGLVDSVRYHRRLLQSAVRHPDSR
jgi:hypothetical protein